MSFQERLETYSNLQCEGCLNTFSGTGREAFDLGWDCPPYFFSHVTCPNCPLTSTIWYKFFIAT